VPQRGGPVEGWSPSDATWGIEEKVVFEARLMPGLRVRATTGTLRSNVSYQTLGTTAFGGRVAVYSRVGPISVGPGDGCRRQVGTRPDRRGFGGTAAMNRALAAGAEAEATNGYQLRWLEPQNISDALLDIAEVHRVEFQLAEPPLARLLWPDTAAIVRRHQHQALAATSEADVAEQAAALAEAEQHAHQEVEAARARGPHEQLRLQARLDSWWESLTHNDPGTIVGTLAHTFADNEAAAAPVGVDGEEITLVVLVPNRCPTKRPRVIRGSFGLEAISDQEQADL